MVAIKNIIRIRNISGLVVKINFHPKIQTGKKPKVMYVS